VLLGEFGDFIALVSGEIVEDDVNFLIGLALLHDLLREGNELLLVTRTYLGVHRTVLTSRQRTRMGLHAGEYSKPWRSARPVRVAAPDRVGDESNTGVANNCQICARSLLIWYI
jgi:hypothetical protein